MAQRIDRHELKQDKLASDIAKIYSYAAENPTKVLVWVAVVVVVVVGVIGYISYTRSIRREAQLRLSLVYIFIDTGSYQEALDTLRSLVTNYGKTKQGKLARYLLGHMYYAFGQLDSAIAAYEEYLSYPDADSDLAAACLLGIGACYEEKSQYDKAIDYYRRVVDGYPDFFRSDEAFASMARCYDVKGEREEAHRLYRQFLERYPESPLRNRVIVLLARMEAAGVLGSQGQAGG